MADIVTTEFCAYLKSLYPGPSFQNPWYVVAAITLTALNFPEGVPLVFKYALQDISREGEIDKEKAQVLIRRIRDGVFKAGLLTGFNKVINSLTELYNDTPEYLRDKEPLRDLKRSPEELAYVGQQYFNTIYGEKAESVQGLLEQIYPDLGFFVTALGYGFTYSYPNYLSEIETTYCMIAALIPADTPRQIDWHINNVRRLGASLKEVKAVRQISIEVSRKAGMVWKHPIPDLEE